MDNLFIFALVIFFYFIPTIAASNRKHKSASAIALLNFFLGWTILGWLAALIWANTGNVEEQPATEPERIKCPDCREPILKEANVCKHCGCRLSPPSS